MHDLIIIGGGPAGTAAAITAAKAGARVLLFERGRYPRHKVCGEFVSGESLDLLSGLLDSAPLAGNAVRIARTCVFLDGHVLQTAIDPPAASIARFDLDWTLWRSAVAAGVEARQQTAVNSVKDAGNFMVSTSAGEFKSRAVINCSGRWSNLRSSKAAPKRKWLGIKAHFFEPSPPASVDLYFFDGGYCGVSPVRLSDPTAAPGANLAGHDSENTVNVCAMVKAEVASTFAEIVKRNADLTERARNWRPLTDPVTTAPLIFFDPQPECDGVLMAGDAAGFVDPFVGDGISLALRSGALAARCLVPFLRGEASLSAATQTYGSAYANWLRPVFRTSARVRRMLLLPRALRQPIVSILERTPALTSYLVSKTR